MEKFALATQANIVSDARAFLDYLAPRPDVQPGGIGSTGYCMGASCRSPRQARTRIGFAPETYPTKHGWVFRDVPVYDAAAAERHWQTMLALFGAMLKRAA
jgi:dienelactone hydrolase